MLVQPDRLCISDPRRTPRTLMLRLEVWLCRWWAEARADGRNAEAAEIWGAAHSVSALCASIPYRGRESDNLAVALR